MRTLTFAELSTRDLSAAKLDAFFSALRINEADPLIPADSVPKISRHLRVLNRSAADFPLPATSAAALDPRQLWRTVLGKFRARSFFPESVARDVTLGPRLPHHRRHPLTADEALAGIVVALGALGAVIYLLARLV